MMRMHSGVKSGNIIFHSFTHGWSLGNRDGCLGSYITWKLMMTGVQNAVMPKKSVCCEQTNSQLFMET